MKKWWHRPSLFCLWLISLRCGFSCSEIKEFALFVLRDLHNHFGFLSNELSGLPVLSDEWINVTSITSSVTFVMCLSRPSGYFFHSGHMPNLFKHVTSTSRQGQKRCDPQVNVTWFPLGGDGAGAFIKINRLMNLASLWSAVCGTDLIFLGRRILQHAWPADPTLSLQSSVVLLACAQENSPTAAYGSIRRIASH